MKIQMFIFKLFLCILVLFLPSCSNDLALDQSEVEEGELMSFLISAQLDLPNDIETQSRAVGEDGIQLLHVLLFDENELFLSKHEAILKRQTDKNTYVFEVMLPQSNKKRVFNFIANKEASWWTKNFNEEKVHQLRYQKVAEVHKHFYSDSELFYWGLSSVSALDTRQALSAMKIELTPNVAKIELVDSSNRSDFEFLSFDVHNRPAKGFIASAKFRPTTTGGLQKAFGQSSRVIHATKGKFEQSYRVFEKDNQRANARASVILKARFQGKITYYKLELINKNTGVYYNFERQRNYRIRIQRVTKPGSNTLEEALRRPASNNIYYDVDTQHIPVISDGVNTLSIGKMGAIFVDEQGSFDTDIAYSGGYQHLTASWLDYPSTSTHGGDGKKIAHPNNADMHFVFYPYSKKLQVRYNANKIKAGTYKLVISTTDGTNLTRVLQFRVMPRYSSSQIDFWRNQYKNGNQNTAYALGFKVPSDMHESAFPFYIYVDTKYLDGDPISPLEVVLNRGNQTYPISYRYKVTKEMRGQYQTLRFRFNRSVNLGSSSLFRFHSAYFNTITY